MDDDQLSTTGSTDSSDDHNSDWTNGFMPANSVSCEVVNYYFPVEVIVSSSSGGITPAVREDIQASVFQDLYDAINRRLV